jgi:hypothetical protein
MVSARLFKGNAYDNHDEDTFAQGCRYLRHKLMAVPRDLMEFMVYFVNLSGKTYVCGLKLESGGRSGRTKCMIGYKSSHFQSHVLGEGEDQNLFGFRVALSARGIRAIQLKVSPWNDLPWLGDPTDCSVTTRLETHRRITHIGAGFDVSYDTLARFGKLLTESPKHQGFKMVSLRNQTERWRDDFTLLQDTKSSAALLASTIWEREVPPKTVDLNPKFLDKLDSEDQFCGFVYNPFFWVSFGGEAGEDLCHLREVHATVDTAVLMDLDFYYTSPRKPKRFGNMNAQYRGDCKTVRFTIDGPGGERITAVDLLYNPWPSLRLRPDNTYWTIQVWFRAEI